MFFSFGNFDTFAVDDKQHEYASELAQIFTTTENKWFFKHII